MDKEICQLVTIMLFTVILQISAVFIEVPLPLNVIIEQRALFRCTHTTADIIGWRVNDTSVRNLPDFVAHETLAVFNGTLTSNLTIETYLRFNETQVDCVALFFHPTSGTTESSPTVTLRIQGPLQKITNLDIDIKSNVLKLSWDAPFSLDLTNVDPDVIYYVQVINTTCGNGSIMFRNGTITETELNLFGYSQHHTYEVIVTPRSNVEGAKNGTTLITQVEFVKYRVIHLNVCFEDVLFGAHAQLTMIEIISGLFKAKPASYSVLLVPNDGINEETAIQRATIDEMDRNSIDLGLQPLPLRRRWNYTVIAYNCNQHSLTNTAELSTHDIQNIQIYSPSSGQIQISGVFVEGATAMGILVIIYPLDHVNLNVYYFEAFETMITNTITTTVTGLSAGQYGISVFIIEDGGLPFNRSASAPKRLLVQNGKDVAEPETTIEYRVTQVSTSGHGVCVECTFLDKSAVEYCVVIVHEKVLCFGLSQCEINLTNIVTSFKIARSGDKGYRCIQNINVTNYQVGVIGGRQVPHLVTNTDSTCCTNDLSLAVVSPVLIVLIGVVTMALILILTYSYCRCSKRARSMHYGMPVPEVHSQESEPRYLEVPSRSEDSTRTISSELPTYDQVAAQSDFLGAYQAETRESPIVYQASTNVHTDSQTTTPFTIENLVKYLLPVADKWKDIGEVLSVTENILDEIFTKCNSPQDCLREMLKYYLVRSDLVRDWVEITNALRKLGEEALANEISQGRLMSDTNALDRGPTEAVPTMEESVGDREPCGDLAIAIPEVTPNQATEDYPTSDSGVTLLVGLSVSVFHAQKIEVEQVHVASSSDHDSLELAYPIPETVQEADPTKSQCIHLQHDDQREIDQESIGESDTSRDSSSSIHFAGLNEDYSNVRRHRHFSVNPTELQRPPHEYVISSYHHVYSDSEELHSSSLCHVHPDGAQALQIEPCICAESDDQLNTCTTEPHNVIRFMEDLQAEHCAPEPSSIV